VFDILGIGACNVYNQHHRLNFVLFEMWRTRMRFTADPIWVPQILRADATKDVYATVDGPWMLISPQWQHKSAIRRWYRSSPPLYLQMLKWWIWMAWRSHYSFIRINRKLRLSSAKLWRKFVRPTPLCLSHASIITVCHPVSPLWLITSLQHHSLADLAVSSVTPQVANHYFNRSPQQPPPPMVITL